eukprot:TRINITY_DN10734_c0_g2_i1.p1 TRINITY_DN10734_c0_g2~~TRINITY_DN10734_c0_g2_i1.p1  ORF type:complete len:253 (+),score=48.13 TRINITY_DN10734_c0_g2_i1:173-931(+)
MHRQKTTGALYSPANPAAYGVIYSNPPCPENSARSLLTPARHSKPPIPIIENQGFFRLPNPRKQHNQEIVTPLVCAPLQFNGRNCSLQKLGSYSNLLSAKSSGRKVNCVQSPQIQKTETSPSFTLTYSKENKYTVAELKCQLSNKEIEILDLRNEKMRLEMLVEDQRKSLLERAREIEGLKKLKQGSEEYSKMQKVLKVQQETHDNALIKLKEKVYLSYKLVVCKRRCRTGQRKECTNHIIKREDKGVGRDE